MKANTPELMKFQKLQRRLKESRRGIIGMLEGMWLATARNCPAGDIGRFSNEEIAIMLDWDGDPDELVNALVDCRWIDLDNTHRLVVHDWLDHCPSYIKGGLRTKSRVLEPQAIAPSSEPPAIAPSYKPQAIATSSEPQAIATSYEPQAIAPSYSPQLKPQAIAHGSEPQAIAPGYTYPILSYPNQSKPNQSNSECCSEAGVQPAEHQPPPVAGFLGPIFPTVGDAKTWQVSGELVSAWREAYPAVDVDRELKRAAIWVNTNLERRKTARGMPKFLSRWMAKANDSPRPSQANGKPKKPSSLPQLATGGFSE